jgi:thiosulfate/3-mercaptopyruvate sulfurtransferase
MLSTLPLLLTTLLGADTLLVSPAWLSARRGEAGIVVVHVDRTRSEYDMGHIPGSHFLPLSSIIVERDGVPNELPPVAHLDSVLEAIGIGNAARVIITGDPLSAARLFFTLDYLGHGGGAALLDGGTAAWIDGGWPVSIEPTPSVRASFTPAPRPEVVVDGGWVKAHLDTPGVVFVDARPQDDFVAGHIPGARSIYWKLTLDGSPPALQSEPWLLGLFHGSGVPPGDQVVTYCRSGMQASFLYFVARYLGYETKMYDGSMAEWLGTPGAPVETGVTE